MATAAAKIVGALDLGSGFCKHSIRDPETGEISYGCFPSLAPRHNGVDLATSAFSQRDTVVVDVDGSKYEVGPDSATLDINDSTRSLNESYIYTEQYKAVFLGALHYMRSPVIDLLVVGLPLNNMGAAKKLRDMMVGKHKVVDGIVEVKEALVVAQPLGGLHYCLSMANSIPALEFMAEETNLIIDPGFLTFDYLLANGDKMNEKRSDAYSGGVSKVLRSIGESISVKFDIKYDNLGALDAALRRRKLKVKGVVEPIDEHIRNTKSVLEAAVNHMKNVVGDGSDIENLIMLGGGSPIYKKTIEAFYPGRELIVIEDGQLANVKGFFVIGEKHLGLRKK